MLLLLFTACEAYTYSPTLQYQSAFIGASPGELYIQTSIMCDNIKVDEQLSYCKYSSKNDTLICRNITNSKSLSMFVDYDDVMYEVKHLHIKCVGWKFKKRDDNEPDEDSEHIFSGWTPTEDPLDNE